MEKIRFKPHEYIEPEEMANYLAYETMSTSKIYLEEKGLRMMDASYWAWMHIGFTAALHLLGYDTKYCEEVLDITKKLIRK